MSAREKDRVLGSEEFETTVGVGLGGCAMKFEQTRPGWVGSRHQQSRTSVEVRRVFVDGQDEVQVGIKLSELKGESKRLYEMHGSLKLDPYVAGLMAKAIVELDPLSGGDKTRAEIAKRAARPTTEALLRSALEAALAGYEALIKEAPGRNDERFIGYVALADRCRFALAGKVPS